MRYGNDESTGSRWLRGASSAAPPLVLGAGLVCVGLFAAAQADREVAGAMAISAFERARQEALSETPDQSSWSPGRRAGYEASLAASASGPQALLRIPALDLLVPVFSGTGELVLNRGVGWIETTARPGADGNVGLAGHRDGFFRGLKDLERGDVLELQTVEESLTYRIADISIVEPTDVHVLDPTEEPSVTLVTCYPFYFVGSAPQRYIVRAVLDESSRQRGSKQPAPRL